MVPVRPPIPTVSAIAAFAVMLLAVSTYGNDLPPLLTARDLATTSDPISLISATATVQRRQPFRETPEPLFPSLPFEDPWRVALPDQIPIAGRPTTDSGSHQGLTFRGETPPIAPPAAVPPTPNMPSLQGAGPVDGVSGTAGSRPAEKPWISDLEQATFDEGLPVDVLGIIQWTVITLLLSAVFIVVVLRRFAPNRPGRPAGSRRIQVLETTRIAAGSSLQLVQIDSHRFLIALDGAGVKSVTGLPNWFEAPEEADESPASAEMNLQLLRSQPRAADPETGKAA
ncbi:MAG: flagellar biosynthetic protein FliO [Maioricimonas sp. JB049]